MENKQDVFAYLKNLFNDSLQKTDIWRERAKEDFAYYHGHQWSKQDADILREQKRPALTFNHIKPRVDAILGAEINNRREVRFIPRTLGKAIPNELLTSAAEWFRDQADADREDTTLFKDAVIAGMGWGEISIDFYNDPNGKPFIKRMDPFKLIWDPSAHSTNLKDAQYLFYIDKKPISELKDMFPDAEEEEFYANLQADIGDYAYDDDYGDDSKKIGQVIEARYKEKAIYYRIKDLNTGQEKDISEQEFKKLKDLLGCEIPHIKFKKIITKRAYLGATKLLQDIDEPLVPDGSFGWECVTGFFDDTDKVFYGVVRSLKDPQQWMNKFFSQSMHILNSQSKGGIMVERGAFDDDRQAVESWTKTDQITWLRPGALSQGKIQPKPSANFPAGFFQLFNEAQQQLSQVSGISQEFLGTCEVNQPGILEAQRKQSSLNILASLFDNLKEYRKNQGKVMLYLIQNFLADGRLIKILGDDQAQYVPLIREDICNIEYDIVVDEAPTTVNEKERTFAILMQLIPQFQNMMTPDIVMEFLRYSPIPTSLVEKLKNLQQQQRQQQLQQLQQLQQQSQQQQRIQ